MGGGMQRSYLYQTCTFKGVIPFNASMESLLSKLTNPIQNHIYQLPVTQLDVGVYIQITTGIYNSNIKFE